ncbi:hypothetical protein ACA910_017473 [Epithemia clementina (nom. ined.)]
MSSSPSSSTLQSQFDAAAEAARTELPSSLSNDVKGQIYGLYKQATVGDVTGSRPSLLQFTAQSKYDAWNKVKGLSPEEAMTQYIALIQSFSKK